MSILREQIIGPFITTMVFVVLYRDNPDSVYFLGITVLGVYETREAMQKAIKDIDINKLFISEQEIKS